MLQKSVITRTLKAAQTGNLHIIKQFHEESPCHWSELKYDKTGDTILHCAARLGHLDIINYLLSNYTPNAVNCRNNDNKTALHEAAQFGQHLSCKLLLDYGAEVNVLKKADWTPLMLACTKVDESTWENNYKCVKVLLEHGGLLNYQNKDGWSTIHLIAREGNVEVLRLLFKYNLDVRLRTKNGRTALHVACLHGHLGIVKILIGLGLDVEEKDHCGNTALHEAVLGKNVDVCKFLLDAGADPYCKNKTDFSILHLAASEDDVTIIEFILCELKLDVNLRNFNGLTPLHCAARKKIIRVYEFLVQHGADVTLMDNFNRVPKDYL